MSQTVLGTEEDGQALCSRGACVPVLGGGDTRKPRK